MAYLTYYNCQLVMFSGRPNWEEETGRDSETISRCLLLEGMQALTSSQCTPQEAPVTINKHPHWVSLDEGRQHAILVIFYCMCTCVRIILHWYMLAYYYKKATRLLGSHKQPPSLSLSPSLSVFLWFLLHEQHQWTKISFFGNYLTLVHLGAVLVNTV